MKHIIRCAAFIFALLLPIYSYGMTMIIPLKPETLNHGNRIFTVQVTATPIGADCVVTFREIKPTLSDFGAGICTFERTFYPDGKWKSETTEPVRSLDLVKHDDTYTSTFAVSQEELDAANTYFILSADVNIMVDGKLTPMPSADCYLIRLKDFISK